MRRRKDTALAHDHGSDDHHVVHHHDHDADDNDDGSGWLVGWV